MPFTLTLLFVLSGAAGLIYESIWSRYLALFVGHSAYAQLLVLVIFLGGMSAGAMIAARRSASLREPLFAYAIVEAVAGVLGLLFHASFSAVTALAYDHLFPALAGTPWLTATKWSLAGLLILPSSVLLGATFPLMSAGLIRRVREAPGRVLAVLYFANSLGAAIGVLASGFWLVSVAGLPGTVAAAAMLNLAVAAAVIAALSLERGAQRVTLQPAPVMSGAVDPQPVCCRPALTRGLLLVCFGTAVASFIYEIAWTRMLSLVLGSATHSFELMLSAFILGLALGALWMRKRIDTLRDPARALGMIQWAMGILAVATLPVYAASFHWISEGMAAFTRTDSGYHLFTLARYGICLAVMLPATVCAGMTLPLITRMLIANGAGERAIGTVYAVNTLGSILGAIFAALVLLPLLGLEWMLVAGAALDAALGVALLWTAAPVTPRSRAWAPVAAVTAALLLVSIPLLAPLDRGMLASGVFRTGMLPEPGEEQMLYYRDGRTATVCVERARSDGKLTLSTNGKPDASLDPRWLAPAAAGPRLTLDNDESTQVLLAIVTLAHAPAAHTAAVIGMGSGVTSHFLLGSSRLASLATIEIESEIVHAARAFYPANARVFDDPRSRVVIDDAKSYFAAGQRRFDLILSEPSNPWVSGVAGLFTAEFYHRVRSHLSQEGVFGQWLHLYEIDDRLVLTVIAALQDNFRDYEVFMVSGCDILIVATNRRSGLKPDWSVANEPAIAHDLARVVPLEPRDFEAMRLANRAALAPLAAGVRPNSDYFPALDLGAERARFMLQYADGFAHLNADRFSLVSMVQRRPAGLAEELVTPTPGIPRARARALSAWLRTEEVAVGPKHNVPDPNAEGARLRKRMLEDLLAAGVAPPDWLLWARTALMVESDMHGGTAGAVDEEYYRSLERFMTRAAAPAEAFSAIRFTRAVATWDYESAAHAADTLIAASRRGENWVAPELLRDGTVTAKLMTGDVAGARRTMIALAPLVRVAPGDLRARLLASYVVAVEQAQQPQPEIRPAARR